MPLLNVGMTARLTTRQNAERHAGAELPYRGDGSGRPDVLLPPDRMPLLYKKRPLKKWRYLGAYGETYMVCAGLVNVAGVPQAFWAVWDRTAKRLHEHTTKFRTGHVRIDDSHLSVHDGAVRLELAVEADGEPVETLSNHGPGYIWTRKLPVAVEGTVTIDGVAAAFEARGLIDDSAGYHARHTAWEWSAGVGTATDGRRITWNLVTGLHDSATNSERSIWVDGVPSEPSPVAFAQDLSSVRFADGAELGFREESVRTARENLLLVASDYRQPFGVASGTLPGGVTLAEGFGVMERHTASW